MSEDPLAALVVDEEQLAREELARALAPYIRFGRGGGLLPEDRFDSLPAALRVECTLLAFRAASLLGLRNVDGATPQEVARATGIPGGTVRPALRRLLDDRVVVQQGRTYRLAPYAMQRV